MPLRFGTAGVRAPLGAGPECLNEGSVTRIAAGIGTWVSPGSSVVIGHDARHGSAGFARVVARELRARGLVDVALGQVPTPVLAFAVQHGDYAAGVIVTASHNPPGDNGIKVYESSGAQVSDAQGAEIEACVAAPRPGAEIVTAEMRTADAVAPYLAALPQVVAGALRIAYTPMHGVGGAVFEKALRQQGFGDVSVVTSQAEPDPDFPTVPFPNPEEPGALDALRALLAQTGADIGLAHDPDADRLAVLVGDRMLTGDETGLLLADEVLRRMPGPVATTFVSSSVLGILAARRGVPCAWTATGFKNLVRAHGGDLVFAYEEALGYCVAPDQVRDKDGISAGLLVASMAAAERAAGRTLLDRLVALEAELGVEVATAQVSLPGDDPAELLEQLRHALPQGFFVVRDDPFTITEGALRVIVRPSGTEPKLKAYLQATSRAELPALRERISTWLTQQ